MTDRLLDEIEDRLRKYREFLDAADGDWIKGGPPRNPSYYGDKFDEIFPEVGK